MTATKLEALARDVLMPTYNRLPVEFARGDGARLYDADGTEYLDFLSGIAVASIGHAHPALVEAISEQVGRLAHASNLFYSEPAVRLARRLSEGSLGGKVFFCNSGAEASECAIKLARRHKPRGEIVVLEGAFHGRTLGALSATPQPEKQRPFEPLVPGFRVAPRDDPLALLDAVDDHTAAVMIEPVQGESGIHPVPAAVLAAARDACTAHGALLVFDEVQCGTGRTGRLWAWQGGEGVRPDVMTAAKGLGGGVPIGACVAAPEFSDLFQPGDHGSTFAGGPLVSAAANAVLDVVDDEGFLGEVAEKGEALAAGLRALGLGARGRGLMLAFEVPDAPALVRRALLERRLVLNATGPTTVRLLPPLTVASEEVEEALRRIGALLGAAPRSNG